MSIPKQPPSRIRSCSALKSISPALVKIKQRELAAQDYESFAFVFVFVAMRSNVGSDGERIEHSVRVLPVAVVQT